MTIFSIPYLHFAKSMFSWYDSNYIIREGEEREEDNKIWRRKRKEKETK